MITTFTSCVTAGVIECLYVRNREKIDSRFRKRRDSINQIILNIKRVDSFGKVIGFDTITIIGKLQYIFTFITRYRVIRKRIPGI